MTASSPVILVVDDNPATRYSTSRVLKGAGFQVAEAESGQQALHIAEQGVDLIILDVNLPDMDGFEVCRLIRAKETTMRTPVVHLSATFVQDIHKIHGLESGADGYLTHPIEPPVLIATVNAFLRARHAELASRQSEIRFKAIFENVPSGVAVLDQSHRFVEANPAMCQLLQIDNPSLAGQSLFAFVPTEYSSSVNGYLKVLASTGAWKGTFPLNAGDGRTVQLAWHISAHTHGHTLATISDITDQIRYQEEREALLQSERSARSEAERANRLKDEFLATLSHELRTPLNSIVGWAQLLGMGGFDDATLKEGLETIERNAHAQSQMIADLLDVARITSGKIRLEAQMMFPADTLEAAITAVQPAIDAKGIRLIKTMDQPAGPITGDSSRLQQVFWNLLNNAVKFTPKQGRIQVSLRRVNSHIEIRIADNGQGLSATVVSAIFERFRQVDASTTREHGGLGLGLAISKQLVEMHGGSIRAESPGLGLGSTFIVSLPIAPVQQQDDASEESSHSAKRISPELNPVSLVGLRILVVEDDDDSRALLKRVISAAGADVMESNSAAGALEAIPIFKPQLLISDIGMPQRDGLELIRDVRSRGYSFQELPAIALTAFARAEDRRLTLLAGFQIHLTKPVDPLELNAAIAMLVGRTSEK